MRYLTVLLSLALVNSTSFSATPTEQSKVGEKPTQTKSKTGAPQREAVKPATASSSAPTPAPCTSSEEAAQVRVDGLYYARVGGSPEDPTYQYFRFYADLTGVTTYTSGQPAQVAKWFSRDDSGATEGSYRLEGTTLRFIVGSERAGTIYSGILTKDCWVMNPQGPNTTKFAFAQVSFPAEAAITGKNRDPKIDPVVSKMDSFAYDSAGRVVGVTTTIEVTAKDADGDLLTYSWTVSIGSITGDGSKGVWSRPIVMGRPGGGVATVTVTDGKGGKTSRDFAFQ